MLSDSPLGPTLETPRLILRPPRAEDLDGFAELLGDAEAAHFIGGVQARSSAWRSMATMAGSWALKGFAMFSVIERATGLWVGRIGPWSPEGWPGTEVGWGVAPEFAGRGYAYEGSVAAMDYAVDVLGWTTIIHTINPDNLGSIRLAQRLGSYNMGPTQLPAPYLDERVDAWGQTADEWRARRAAAK